MPRPQGSVYPLWLEGKNQAHFDLSPGLGAGATGVRVAALTWLVEKAPEFILHISLALLQVLLLEAGGRNKSTVNSALALLPYTMLSGKILCAELYRFWGGEQD